MFFWAFFGVSLFPERCLCDSWFLPRVFSLIWPNVQGSPEMSLLQSTYACETISIKNGKEKLIPSTALVSIESSGKISVLFFISQPPTPLLMQINCLRRRISNIVFLFIRSCFLIMRPFNRPGAYCFAALWGETLSPKKMFIFSKYVSGHCKILNKRRVRVYFST